MYMPIHKTNGAFIYSRVSTTRQDVSIEVQVEKCIEHCNQRGIAVNQVFSDTGHSGKNLERPSLNNLLRVISTNPPQFLVVYRLDRLSRSVGQVSELVDILNSKDVQLISVCEPYINSTTSTGKLQISMLMACNQLERESIVARVKESLAFRKRNGMKYTRITPYGMHLSGNRYEECQEEQETIKIICQLYSEGASLSQITQYLNEKRVPTRKGKPWGRSSVSIIIHRRMNSTAA